MNNGWRYSDSEFALLLNNVENYATVNKFGAQTAVTTTALAVSSLNVAYTYSTAAETIYITSSSAADTNLDYVVHGLDSDFNLQTETVTTDGTNPTLTEVALANQYIRIYRAYAATPTQAAGTIWFGTDATTAAGVPGTDAQKRAAILPNANQTLMAMFTTPANYCGVIVGMDAQTINKASSDYTTIRLETRDASTLATPEVFRVRDHFEFAEGAHSILAKNGVPLARVGEKHDIQMTAQAQSGSTNRVSAQFKLILVPEDNINLGGITSL